MLPQEKKNKKKHKVPKKAFITFFHWANYHLQASVYSRFMFTHKSKSFQSRICLVVVSKCAENYEINRILLKNFIFLGIVSSSGYVEELKHGATSQKIFYLNRSSHRRCSVRKDVLKSFAKFTGKHLCQSRFFNKVASLQQNF